MLALARVCGRVPVRRGVATAELRADLDAQLLFLGERDLELERTDRDGVRLPCAETDVHPFALGIPVRTVREAVLVERRAEFAVDGGERVADERLRHAALVVVGS